jgi:acyl-CoA thioesterase-1
MKHFRDGKLDVSGQRLVPIDQYDKNLRKLVNRLEATGAKLIWASTTPVPEGADGRKPSDPPAYNAVAEKIMKERGIAMNDLYSFALPRLSEMQHPRNVHFTEPGSRMLAEQVARSILKALGQ